MNSETHAIFPCEGFRCVQSLLGNVSTLSFQDKYHLVTSPKPTPDLIISHKSKSHNRYFHRLVYKTR